jgi:SPFH domain / Band 7 family
MMRMSFIQEIVDLVNRLTFFDVVHEYEQGLYFRNGIVLERRIRGGPKKDLDQIIEEEQEAVRQAGGKRMFIIPFSRPKLPQGYRRSFWTGMPLHPKRFHKVLKPGLYFHLPFIDDVVKDYKQERIINLGYISGPTSNRSPDDRVMAVSCNIRYELMDFYKAYTSVHDYEASLKDHALSILAKHCRGKSYETWCDPKEITNVEKATLEELRSVVTEKWGLKIHNVYITDNVPCSLKRVVHEGNAISITNKMEQPEGTLI